MMPRARIMRLFAALVLAGIVFPACDDDDGNGPIGAVYTQTDEIGTVLSEAANQWTPCDSGAKNPADVDVPVIITGPEPAFPNATNGMCTIDFNLASAQSVAVTIWRTDGETQSVAGPSGKASLVAALTDGMHVAGLHRVIWNGLDSEGNRASPGVYRCRFETADCTSGGQINLVACPYGTERLLEADMLAYLEEHWSAEKLRAAYDPVYLDRPGADKAFAEVVGLGLTYFPDVSSGAALEDIPLYVSPDLSLSLHVENIAMWNHLVFGWDDFVDPNEFMGGTEPDYDHNNLSDPRTSGHREVFRATD